MTGSRSSVLLDPRKLADETHLRIGRLLAAHTPPERRRRQLEIVSQLNRGPADHLSRGREQVAERT